METSWPKEQHYSPHLLHQGYKHKNWSQKRKMSLLSQTTENLCFVNIFVIWLVSMPIYVSKSFPNPQDHFYANTDGIISNFEYREEKMIYDSIFGGASED